MKKQLLFLTAFAVFYCGAYAQTILGVDVSHYQGTITWSQVKNPGGKTFAWAKATEGVGYTDADFVTNATNGTAAGVVMGAYHFAHPETNTAAAEASYFLSVARPYIGAGKLPPALDLEDPPGGTALVSYFTSAALTQWVQEWMTAVQNATGIAPVLYTQGDVANYVNSSLTVYKLWTADPDNSPTATPSITYLGVWPACTFKQYSWTGTVSGISGTGDEDLDVFKGTTTEFNNLIGGNVVVSFTANATTVCAGSTVTFTDHSTSTGTITGHSWTFTGGCPPTSAATNPTVTYNTGGSYAVKEVVTSGTGKDSVTQTAYIEVIPSGNLPLVETFQSAAFPPAGWTMNYPQVGDSAWKLCTNNGYNSTQCMYFPANCGYVTNIAGERQQIYTPDYSFATTTNAKMWFDVAYEPYNTTYSDTLAVYYSLDCGINWTNIYLKGGSTLCTTGSTVAVGTDTSGGRGCCAPPNAQAWRTDSISLPVLNNQSSVMFSLESRSGWGNIVYLDNINVAGTTVTTCTPPAAPVAVSPGTVTGPGSNVTSVNLQWDTAAGAVTYYPRISQCPYGTPNIVWFDTCYVGISESVTTLAPGNLYRWNIGAFSQCGNANCESDGNTLYFNIPPVLASTGSTSFCSGDSVNLHTTAGNTVATATFYWYLNGTLLDSTSTGNYYAKQAGSYTAAISYPCGVTGAGNAIAVSLTAPPAVPSVTTSPGATACGAIQLTAASSGCSGCTYSWSNNATGSVISVSSTGTYKVTATDAGCGSSPGSVSVIINQPPTVSASASVQQACINQQVTLSATGNATSYLWSGSGLQTTTGSTVDAIVSTAGSQNYTVTATLNGCSAIASTSVSFNTTLPPAITISQTTANPICNGSAVSFSASSTNGGTSPFYQWETSTGLSGTGSTFTLNNAGSATVVSCLLISNAACASTDSVYSNAITINTQVPQPVSIAISTPDTNVCSGENIVFASIAANGGTSPVFGWYVNGVSSGSGASYTVNNIQAAASVYCVLTSNASCIVGSPATSNTITVHIQTSALASVSIAASNNPVCAGTPVTFTATPGNGGNAPVYTWQLDGNTVGTNSVVYANGNVHNGATVSCAMVSSSSCVTNPSVMSDTITMQVNPLPIANAGNNLTVPSTASAILGGNPTASFGKPPYTYAWSPVTGLDYSSVANPVDSGITANTTYTVQVTDSNGCTASATILVDVITCTMQNPTVEVNYCDMAAQNITNVTYQWLLQGVAISGATTRFYNASQSGYFNAKITDTAGCTAQSADIYISYPACLGTGITTVSDNPEFDIYPNPASAEVIVSFSNTLAGSARIEIFDVCGQLVYTGNNINITAGNKYPVRIGQLAAGSYLLRVINNQSRIAVKRFIKM